jgi:hypothetical protein
MSNLKVTFSNFSPLGDHLCDGKSFDIWATGAWRQGRNARYTYLDGGVATYELEWRGGGYRWLVTSYSACLIWDGIEHTLSVDLFAKTDTHRPSYSPPRERLFTPSEAKRELKKKILQLISELEHLPHDDLIEAQRQIIAKLEPLPSLDDLKGAQRRIIVLEEEIRRRDAAMVTAQKMIDKLRKKGETAVELQAPTKCTHPKGHFVDNQGYCHCCGIPMNEDWIAASTGESNE